jgi:hypothetical protein
MKQVESNQVLQEGDEKEIDEVAYKGRKEECVKMFRRN